MALPEPKKNRIRTKSAGHWRNGHSECQYRMTTHLEENLGSQRMYSALFTLASPGPNFLARASSPEKMASKKIFRGESERTRVRRPPRRCPRLPSRARRARRDIFRGVLRRPASIELQRLPLCCQPCSSRLTKWTSQETATPRARRRSAMPGPDSVIPRCLCAAPVRFHCLCPHQQRLPSALHCLIFCVPPVMPAFVVGVGHA